MDAELDEPRGCGRHIKTINNTSQKEVASHYKKNSTTRTEELFTTRLCSIKNTMTTCMTKLQQDYP